MSGYEYAMLVLRRLRVHRVTRADGSTEDLQDLAEPTLLAWFNTYVRQPAEATYAEDSRRWHDGYAAWRGQIAVNERATPQAPWLVRYPDGRVLEVYAPDAQALEGRLRYEFVQTGHPEPVLAPHPNHYQEWVAASVRQQRTWFAELHTESGVVRERHATPFLWYGVPVEPIVAELNRLGRDGWQLVAASEDKGLYSGQDTTSEASPVVVRYTLSRPRTGAGQSGASQTGAATAPRPAHSPGRLGRESRLAPFVLLLILGLTMPGLTRLVHGLTVAGQLPRPAFRTKIAPPTTARRCRCGACCG